MLFNTKGEKEEQKSLQSVKTVAQFRQINSIKDYL